MAFLHRLIELKLNNDTYTTDTESGIEIDNRQFNTESVAVNGGVHTTQSKRLPSLSSVTLKNINKEQLIALETLNDAATKFAVTFTLASDGGEVTYSGTVRIEGELAYNSHAGTVSLNLVAVDGNKFTEI